MLPPLVFPAHSIVNFLDFLTNKKFFSRSSTLAFVLQLILSTGNTKGGGITVLLTSCLTGLDLYVLQIKTKIVSCHTAEFQTNQTGGQWYSDTSPFSIPCSKRSSFSQ